MPPPRSCGSCCPPAPPAGAPAPDPGAGADAAAAAGEGPDQRRAAVRRAPEGADDPAAGGRPHEGAQGGDEPRASPRRPPPAAATPAPAETAEKAAGVGGEARPAGPAAAARAPRPAAARGRGAAARCPARSAPRSKAPSRASRDARSASPARAFPPARARTWGVSTSTPRAPTSRSGSTASRTRSTGTGSSPRRRSSAPPGATSTSSSPSRGTGSMSSLRLLKSSGTASLDRAAQNALSSSRLLPLPDDYGPPRVTMNVELLLQRGAAGLLTRARVVHHAGVAWAAAVAGAWLVAASCRTMRDAPLPALGPEAVPPPRQDAGERPIRVGVRVGVEQASIAAPGGVSVRGAAAGENVALVRALAARHASGPRPTPAGSACSRPATSWSAPWCSPPTPSAELSRRRDTLPRRRGGPAGRGRHDHRRERGAARGVPARRGAERARARGLPADRGAEGAGGRRPQLRARAPRRLLLAGLRRVRHRGLPGLPGLLLRAPAHRSRGRRDARARSPPGAAGRSTPSTRRPAAATPRRERPSSRTGRPTCAASPARPSARSPTSRGPAGSGRCGCGPQTWRAPWPATAASARCWTWCRRRSASRAASWSCASLGSEGQLDLRGQRVRLGLGLRESLFVLHRETDARGRGRALRDHGQGLGSRRGPVPGRRLGHGAGGRVLRGDPEALLHRRRGRVPRGPAGAARSGQPR